MKSRSKSAVVNTVAAIIQEIVVIICGFILPRFILEQFGSTYNGLTQAITQFLGCAVLFRAGIGGATRAALYKPLAENNKSQINAIMSATDRFMKKVGIIIACMIILFSIIYPFLVIKEFDYFFTFSLFLIIGLSTFAESFFGISYMTFLHADQKLYIDSVFQIVTYILNTVISIILIKIGASIHIVKLGSAIVFVLYPVLISMYVKRKYDININVEPDNKVIAQRWDAFFHQVANFVMTNTDTLVLTIFTNMYEVSVYSVYNLIINGLRKLTQKLLNGFEASFGNIIAKNENDKLFSNFKLVEFMVFNLATLIFVCTGILIVPFVSLYTKGVNDISYERPLFAFLIVVAQYFNCIRQPYQLVVQAAGHYKQTKKGAIIEPIINIVLSVILSYKLGLVGVAIGTLAATLFRTVQYMFYSAYNILHISVFSSIVKVVVSVVEAFLITVVMSIFIPYEMSDYGQWIFYAVLSVGLSIVVILFFSFLFFRTEMKLILKKSKKIFKR